MRIMSERRFQEELAKAKEEIYQREQADRRMMAGKTMMTVMIILRRLNSQVMTTNTPMMV